MKKLITISAVCLLCGVASAIVTVLGRTDAGYSWLPDGSGGYVLSWTTATPAPSYWVDTNSPVLRLQGTYYADGYRLYDSSGGAYHFTNVAAGAQRVEIPEYPNADGTTNSGFFFDSADDYLSVSQKAWFTNSDAFMLSLRLKPSGVFSSHASPRLIDDNGGIYFVITSTFNLDWVIFGSGGGYIQLSKSTDTGAARMTSNVWYNLVLAYDGGTNYSAMSVWTNGVQTTFNNTLNSGSFVSRVKNDNALTLMRAAVLTRCLGGTLDDVRFYPFYNTNIIADIGSNSWTNEQVFVP